MRRAGLNLVGVLDSLGGATSYQYDALHRMTRVEQSGTGVTDKRVDFAYNAAGQFDTIARYSDLSGTQLVADSSYGYLCNGQPQSWRCFLRLAA